MSKENLSIKEQVLHWAEGLYTEVVLTQDVKDEIISEIDNIPDARYPNELLKEVLYVLNQIPNHRNIGRNGESSYEMASKVGEYLRNNPIT